MADMILGSAQGAVDSLLGRLTSVLVEEAQLLGGVRGDVQFIKDEMESMNGFLMHVAEATGDDDDDDHQVRAWMKQVAEVAYASQNSIDLYVQSLRVGTSRREPGFLGYLRRLPRLVWTLPTRHRVAKQIRELKIRSCEVGERRVRYDVRAPDRGNRASTKSALWQAARGDDDAREQEDARRRALADAHQSDGYRGVVIKWLRDEEDSHGEQDKVRVMAITGVGDTGKTCVARSAYQDAFAVSSFDCQAWVDVGQGSTQARLLREILAQVTGTAYMPDSDDKEDVLVEKLLLHLDGKRFLLVLDDVCDTSVWDSIKSALFDTNCCPGSAVLVTTRIQAMARSFFSADSPNLQFGFNFCGDYFKIKAISLFDINNGLLYHNMIRMIINGQDRHNMIMMIINGQDRHEDDPSDSFRDVVIKWLGDEQDDHAELRVMAIAGLGGMGKTYIAHSAYKDPVATSSFDCKAWVNVGQEFSQARLLQEILAQVTGPAYLSVSGDKEEVLIEKLLLHLEGKRFLVVLDDVWDSSVWSSIKSALFNGNRSPGSAVLVTTRSAAMAFSVYSREVSNLQFGFNVSDGYFVTKAISLLHSNNNDLDLHVLIDIIRQLDSHFAVRLFLRDLYVNPNQNQENLQSLCDTLRVNGNRNIFRQVLVHVYSKLPSDCKNCLLYLSILPENTTFTRPRLLRRWVAEGMITRRGRLGALDQAERYFDLLVAHGLVMPTDIGTTGKVKTFTVHALVHDFVMDIARGENLSNANLQPDLAHRLSIRNEVQLQLAENNATRSKASCWNICNHFKESDQTQIDQSNATEVFLESLSSSSTHLGLLEMLDLEDCKQLTDHHLKNICNHVFQLKYLSLRNTNITELPKQLDKLRYLETLDIRQTNVRAFAKNSVFLPKIKYLLAGHRTNCRSQGNNNNSEETFFTVQMPKHVGGMTEVQVLSHIAVSGSGDELSYIGNLLRLRKLGVVLNGCDRAIFRHLYHTIGNLSKCLRSLSIRAIQFTPSEENAGMDTEGVPPIPPKHLEKLEISGLGNGLPPWIEKLGMLTKITLHKASLTTGDLSILGKLASLCCLRLRQKSCVESMLTFKKEEFLNLKFLIIECSEISSINFDNGASSKLKKIVWSSTEKQSLFGIKYLTGLQEIELTKGKFDLKRMKEEITANENNPVLKIK